MNETNTVVPEPEAVTLESATNVIDFWRQRAEAAEAEAAELRERLAAAEANAAELRTILVRDYSVITRAGDICDKVEHALEVACERVGTAKALVPDTELMERAARYASIAQDDYLVNSTGGSRNSPYLKQVANDEETLDALADAIRAWRGDGDGSGQKKE